MKNKLLLALAASSLVFAAPAAAQSAPRALAQSEVRAAAQEHQQVVDQFGGAMTGPLATYVTGVGNRIAGQTNVAGGESAYRITLLNSPVRNAFAVPGGYVYITRELLALMNNEDELAFVLGHEMGHVAARHGQKRQSRSTLGALGAVIAQVVTGSDAVGQVAGQLGQSMVLGYSRSQENQSDSLGLRYIAAAGYDPYAAPRMLSAMGEAEGLDAAIAGRQQKQSSWGSTHPLSADRVRRTEALARQVPPGALAAPGRDRFLAAIDGMPYGDDPSQGMVDGQRFRHPALRFQFTAPQGYTIQNGASAVSVTGSGGQAQLSMGKLSGSLESYVDGVFRALAGSNARITLPAPQTGTINGMPIAYATTRANSSQGQVDVSVLAYRWNADTAYHFLMLTPAGSGIGPFDGMTRSLGRLSDAEAGAIRGKVVRVVTVGRNDTLQSLAGRMAFGDHQLDRFLVLNGLIESDALKPGDRVKLVVQAP